LQSNQNNINIMNKVELVVLIIKHFKDNRHVKNTDLGFKSHLKLYSEGDTELLIEKYYEYDVTIFEYKDSKKIAIYQKDYSDLPIPILEQIYAQIESKTIRDKDGNGYKLIASEVIPFTHL